MPYLRYTIIALLTGVLLWIGYQSLPVTWLRAVAASPRTQEQPTELTFLPLIYNPAQTTNKPTLPPLLISEFMAGNRTTLLDEDGESSDWIELFNSSAESIDLGGWHLTDDATELTKWRFPNMTLPAGGYLVVFASNKDRITDPSRLHTNFKLARYGGYLALVEPDGKQIAWDYQPAPGEQYSDVSYGVDSARHERYFLRPSPGAANGAAGEDQGPALANVQHGVEPVPAGRDLSVTAVAAAPTGAPQVWLHYRVMYGPLIVLPMLDDGAHGDGAAGDGRYGATIPAGALTAGQMVRYFVTAADSANRTARLPLFTDPASAEYYGAVVQPDYTGSPLPVVHWFVENFAAANTDVGTRASLAYDGEFYDNVAVRIRGDYTRRYDKKSYKVDFTREHLFRFSPQAGRVEEINLNSTYTDRAYIRPLLAWETYRAAGVADSLSFPVRMQRNGAFHSVAILIEQLDTDYLERHDLDPEGALYKMHSTLRPGEDKGSYEKKTRRTEDDGDYYALRGGLYRTGEESRRFLYDNINLPQVINYLAATTLMHDNDAVAKNYYLYRDTNGSGEWQVLPWDKDLTFGRMYTNGLLRATVWADDDPHSHPLFGDEQHPRLDGNWNQLIENIYNVPELRAMYLRRLRSLMDQILQPPGTPYAQRFYETRIDSLIGQMQGDIALDGQKWPPDWATSQSVQGALDSLKNDYLAVRRVHLYQTHGPGGTGLIPDAQPATVKINFGHIGLDNSTPAHDQEYFTLVNPHTFAVDLSGWRIEGGVEQTLQPGVVIPAGGTLYVAANARGFRNRSQSPHGNEGHLVITGYQRRLSASPGYLTLHNAADAVIATIAFPTPLSAAATQLAITELNYHPTEGFGLDGEEFEFIELKNNAASALDLGGYRFSEGIDYTFAPATQLAPGAFAVLVRNPTAFQLRYPALDANTVVLGEYRNRLDNAGERLTLLDAAGQRVFSLTYTDDGPWPLTADGDGYTLVNIRPQQWPDQFCNWRASADRQGGPGADNPADGGDSCPYALYLPMVSR